MPSIVRKALLTVHVATSAGSIGAVAVFLVLALIALVGSDRQLVRAAYLAMDIAARFVVAPLVFAALLTGIVQSLGTVWGLLRHFWVLAKLMLTILTAVVLTLQIGGIGLMAEVAVEEGTLDAAPPMLRESLAIHAAGGLVVLLVVLALSVFKPRGLTPYGWRKQHV